MESGKKKWETSRQAEEGYLRKTLAVVEENVKSYGQEVARMQGNIDEMLAHYHDNDVEVWTILNNTLTLHEHMKRALERNEKALDKPYFGRIIFHDKTLDKEESLYIGRGGISRDTTHWMVVDWRAPVANAYYENSLGKCSYTAPGGVEMEIELELKRTYEVEGGKLLDFYDSEVVANDDLLTKYLAKNKEAVLGEIVATIQKEQNEIIRKSPYHNIIVQGVAGSGKTTVAMHRISYILYNYAERFRPDDFYIVGSNRILLDYITGVLPDLDVYGVRQMTMEQLFVRLLYEDWEEKKYRIGSTAASGGTGSIKGGTAWFRDLEAFCRRTEWEVIPRESVFLDPRQFVEGIRNGKTGVFDETEGKPAEPGRLVRLADRETVEKYIRENPKISVQSKINMLNERLLNKVKEEFLGKGIKYTEAEKKAILKAYRGRYGGRTWKKSVFRMYREFLQEQAAKGYETEVPEEEFDIYDLAALAYLYKRVKETEVISEAHHVVIDEAQDFGMMAYHVLKFCIKDCTYTVMGDVSQNIHFGFGLNDWEELKELLLPDAMDSFGILKKSYRNTVEISDFATGILHHGKFSVYPVEPIIRHGNPVQVRQAADRKELVRRAAGVCRDWQESGLGTIAVICRSQVSAAAVSEELAEYVEVMESNLEKAVFGNGIMVLPVEYTKGLEFDAVLILNPTREEYPADDGHAKLLYVAATRALHELCVLHTGNLTGLIADPLPEDACRYAEEGKQAGSEEGRTALAETAENGGRQSEPGGAVQEGQGIGEQKGKEPEKRKGAGERKQPDAERGGGERKLPEAGRGTGERKLSDAGKGGGERKLPDAEQGKEAWKLPAGQGAEVQKKKKPVASLKGVAGRKGTMSVRTPEEKRPFISRQLQKPSARPAESCLSAGAGGIARKEEHAADVLGSGSRETENGTGSRQVSDSLGNGKPQAKTGSRPAAVRRKDRDGFGFGDMPATEKLRPAGHAKIDLAVRWFSRQEDGLYLQSRYGTLRLSPVSGSIVRVTFAKDNRIAGGTHPLVKDYGTDQAWMYRENGKYVELLTDSLCLQAEKAGGSIRYMSRDKKQLFLAEREKECRQSENGTGGNMQGWIYLDWQKGEKLYGFGAGKRGGMNLRGTARYISHGSGTQELPFVISDNGYGLLLAADGNAFCCDLPSYGSYLYGEYKRQTDFYFIAGQSRQAVLEGYAFLCGSMPGWV